MIAIYKKLNFFIINNNDTVKFFKAIISVILSRNMIYETFSIS